MLYQQQSMVENIMDKKIKLFLAISVMINILLTGVVMGCMCFQNTYMNSNHMPKLSAKFKRHHKENKKIAKECVCAKKRLTLAMTNKDYNEEKFNSILNEYVDCKANFTKNIFEKEKDFYLTLNSSEQEIYKKADNKRKRFKKLIKCNK